MFVRRAIRSTKILKNQKYFNSFNSGFNFNNHNNNGFETTKQIEQIEYPSPGIYHFFFKF